MKNLTKLNAILLLILFSFFFNAKAQLKSPFLVSTITNQNVYKTKAPLVLKRVYNLSTNKPTAPSDTAKYILTPSEGSPFLKYKVVEDGDNPYIRILPNMVYVKKSEDTILIYAGTSEVDLSDENNPSMYYYQMVDDPAPNNHYLATQSIMGMPLTIPLKFRELNGDIQTELDFSLGYAFGYKIKLGNNPYRKKYINFIPFAFAVNKDNYVYKKTNDSLSEKADAISLTYYACGITYEYYGLNIGVFTGWDRMFNENKNWIYQNHNWFSIGIGYKIGKEE